MKNFRTLLENFRTYLDYFEKFRGIKKRWNSCLARFPAFVPEAGLEPARPQWPKDFKSFVSTNSTTRAFFK